MLEAKRYCVNYFRIGKLIWPFRNCKELSKKVLSNEKKWEARQTAVGNFRNKLPLILSVKSENDEDFIHLGMVKKQHGHASYMLF